MRSCKACSVRHHNGCWPFYLIVFLLRVVDYCDCVFVAYRCSVCTYLNVANRWKLLRGKLKIAWLKPEGNFIWAKMNELMVINIGSMRARSSRSSVFFFVGDGISQDSPITRLCSQSPFINQSMMIKICEFLLKTRNNSICVMIECHLQMHVSSCIVVILSHLFCDTASRWLIFILNIHLHCTACPIVMTKNKNFQAAVFLNPCGNTPW